MPHGHARNGHANATAALLLIVGLTMAPRTGHAQGATNPTAIRQAVDAGAYASAEALAVQWAASVQSDPRQRLHALDLLVESRVRNGNAASSARCAPASSFVPALSSNCFIAPPRFRLRRFGSDASPAR